MKKILFILAMTLTVVACGDKKSTLDFSSLDTFNKSVEAAVKTLNDADKVKFQQGLAVISMEAGLEMQKSGKQIDPAIASDAQKAFEASKDFLQKAFEGKTPQDIIKKADDMEKIKTQIIETMQEKAKNPAPEK